MDMPIASLFNPDWWLRRIVALCHDTNCTYIRTYMMKNKCTQLAKQLLAFKSIKRLIKSDKLSGARKSENTPFLPLSLSFVNPKGMFVYLSSFCLVVEHGQAEIKRASNSYLESRPHNVQLNPCVCHP